MLRELLPLFEFMFVFDKWIFLSRFDPVRRQTKERSFSGLRPKFQGRRFKLAFKLEFEFEFESLFYYTVKFKFRFGIEVSPLSLPGSNRGPFTR
jgi:hypothetical protein